MIQHIKIKTPNGELKLTRQEARELKLALDEIHQFPAWWGEWNPQAPQPLWLSDNIEIECVKEEQSET